MYLIITLIFLIIFISLYTFVERFTNIYNNKNNCIDYSNYSIQPSEIFKKIISPKPINFNELTS